jgi:hypothetical protein
MTSAACPTYNGYVDTDRLTLLLTESLFTTILGRYSAAHNHQIKCNGVHILEAKKYALFFRQVEVPSRSLSCDSSELELATN